MERRTLRIANRRRLTLSEMRRLDRERRHRDQENNLVDHPGRGIDAAADVIILDEDGRYWGGRNNNNNNNNNNSMDHHPRGGLPSLRRRSDRRRRNLSPYLDDAELCIVCNKSYVITTSTSTSICRPCFELHCTNYGVWKTWIGHEQADYQSRGGFTGSNWSGNKVVIQRDCVIAPELLLLKRVKACIGWAVHGLIFEFLDGTRVGYVMDIHSINDDAAIKKRRGTDWVDVKYGDYIRAVKGFNLSRGAFLCYTIHLEFASGRTISFASNYAPWKGEPFSYQLPENALLHHVSFHNGVCLGLTATETSMHLPVKSPQRVNTLHRDLRRMFRLIQLVANRIDRERIDADEKPLGRDLWHTIICEYLACYDLQPVESSAIGQVQRASSFPSID